MPQLYDQHLTERNEQRPSWDLAAAARSLWSKRVRRPAGEARSNTPSGPTPLAVGAVPLAFSPLPLEQSRNDLIDYHYPIALGDFNRYYNNTYWGNRLPNENSVFVLVNTKQGPRYTSAILPWMVQTSPEQLTYQLQGGYYPYGQSIQQGSDLVSALSNVITQWGGLSTGGENYGR